ncbi:MAG: 3'-5' exonuclease [Synechococcus sp.]
MAFCIPTLISVAATMTAGEHRVAQRLKRCLDNYTILWYEPPIDRNYLTPDFVLLHPQRGLLVLEVKDWKLNRIDRITPQSAHLKNPAVELKNPLLQARTYAEAIARMLQLDKELINPSGTNHVGKLRFPYGYGVVLANITRKQFDNARLYEVLEPTHAICRDELYESRADREIEASVWGCSHLQFGQPLSEEMVQRIRWHLFPDLRIDASAFAIANETETASPSKVSILRMMDRQQEQLARSLGDGHRVIHGVAGSGKTLILLHRAEQMAKQLDGPILLLCFNVAFAAYLSHAIAARGLSNRVEVDSFHHWCTASLKAFGLPLPPNEDSADIYCQRIVERMKEGIEAGTIPRGRYASIGIDEAHDFKRDWLRIVTTQVDGDINSLLVVYDDAQNLYRQVRRSWSLREAGVSAQGRTTILSLNYRNTQEILNFAYQLVHPIVEQSSGMTEDGLGVISPESCGRQGAWPELVQLGGIDQEANYIVDRCRDFAQKGWRWEDMAIVYRQRFVGQWLNAQLQSAGLPVEWINSSLRSRRFSPDTASIKLMTMHAAKGLEYPIVIIPSLDTCKGDWEITMRLMYVAATRAIERLVMTYQRQTKLVEHVERSLAAARQLSKSKLLKPVGSRFCN